MTRTADSIDALLEVSNKLNERIESYNKLIKDEAEFGLFMVDKTLSEIITVDSVAKFVLVDGQQLLHGIRAVVQHLQVWKEIVDKRIAELKEKEFPSEGSTIV